MADSTKMTNRKYYEKIAEVITAVDVDGKEDILAFVEKQIASIDNRAEKAKERAAAKKAESDAMTDAIYDALTEEPQIAENILEAIIGEFPEATKAKVVSRLSKLVDAGKAAKDKVVIENDETKSKRMAYTLPTGETE
jgi:hypothetical protein